MTSHEPRLLADADGGPVCRDCLHGCPRPPHWAACDVDGCRCDCRARELRAAELDDRGDAALANLARDVETETRPDMRDLLRERFGSPRRGAA